MKAMYYWHMAEYDSYQNEKAMFDNEWHRLTREVAERQAYGTSTPPEGSLALTRRPLAYQYVLNPLTLENGVWASDMTYAELCTAVEKHALPVCVGKVRSGGQETCYLPISAADSVGSMTFFHADFRYGTAITVVIRADDSVEVSETEFG
jgi:hypothetical protein